MHLKFYISKHTSPIKVRMPCVQSYDYHKSCYICACCSSHADPALCTMTDSEVSDNVGATVAGVLIAILVLVGIIATVTVVGVIL